MNDKILWIVDKYLPNPSSNGACVSKLNNAVKEPCESYVLSVVKSDDNAKEYREKFFCLEYDRKPSTHFDRLFSYAEDRKMVKEIVLKACSLIEEHKINTVVCVYRPVECLLAGLIIKAKHKNVKVICYFLDNFTEMSSDSRLKAKVFSFNQTRLLKKIYKKLDKIVALKYYKNLETIIGIEKSVIFAGLPNMVKPEITAKNKTDNTIDMVYAGSFYGSFRTPEPVLNFLKKVCDLVPELHIHLYSWGCDDQIWKMKKIMGEKLVLHGRVTSKEALSAIGNADCLLNVGNDLPHQVPGKLLEYFATGKPVVGYIYRNDDPAKEDYEKYGNMFMVKKGRRNSPESCAEFIKNAKQKTWEEVSDVFRECLPEYTVNAILKNGD